MFLRRIGVIIIILMAVCLRMENRYNNYYPDRFCLKEGIIEVSFSRSIGMIIITLMNFV